MLGEVCGYREKTDKRKKAKNFLAVCPVYLPQLQYGRQMESVAIAQLECDYHLKVQPNGLFVDSEKPWLGASPDGLVGDDTIVEIKCPYVAQQLPFVEALQAKKIQGSRLVNGEVQLSRTQIFQAGPGGTAHHSKKVFLFVNWTPHGMSVEKMR